MSPNARYYGRGLINIDGQINMIIISTSHWQNAQYGYTQNGEELCAWRHDMPPPAVGYAGRCGTAAAHPLRLRRPARLASNSCGRHEY